MIDLVFTSHPTMIYEKSGNFRKNKLKVNDEIDEVDYYINNTLKYIKNKNINNIKISSWCGGDRDGNPFVTPDITKKLLTKINYDLDIRDSSRKINNIIDKHNILDLNNYNFKKIINLDIDIVNTIKIMKENQRFIISDCEKFEHILFIYKISMLLKKNIKIVPLFECKKSLDDSICIIESCIKNNIYKKNIEVMLAYSDTTKTGGLINSVFELYYVQHRLLNLGKSYNITINFFHGVGYSPPRGKSSYLDFFNRIPDDGLENIRLTIQGERIYHEFGDNKKIENTINQIIESYKIRLKNKHNYKDTFLKKIKKISDKSYSHYIGFLDSSIIKFFDENTHYKTLAKLNCGSRPSKRTKQIDNISNIRTITWIFGWSSIHFYLPWWLGLNESFLCFLKFNEFIPWNNILKIIDNGLQNTIITNNITDKLLYEYVNCSKLFYKYYKFDQLELIKKRKFVG